MKFCSYSSGHALQAIETGFGYGVWLHGEAVAAGMVLCSIFFITSEGEREISSFDLHHVYAEGSCVLFSGYGY